MVEERERKKERARALETIVSRLTRRAVIRRERGAERTRGVRPEGEPEAGVPRWIMAETTESTIMAAPGTSLVPEGSVSP